MATQEPSLNQIASKIKKQTELTNQEIRNAAQEVIQEYQPLITDRKPALLFYAQKEHNLQLMQKDEKLSLDIENIVPEMNNIDIEAKVKKVDKFNYDKDGETRKGCDITLQDETGEISMMAWGGQVEEIDKTIQGENVRVQSCYSSEYQGDVQLQYSDSTDIVIVE